MAKFGVMEVRDDSRIGYIMGDLEYPSELHDAHSEYTLAPEKKIVMMND